MTMGFYVKGLNILVLLLCFLIVLKENISIIAAALQREVPVYLSCAAL